MSYVQFDSQGLMALNIILVLIIYYRLEYDGWAVAEALLRFGIPTDELIEAHDVQ